MGNDCLDSEGKRNLVIIGKEPAQSGRFNMAFDECLFESAETLGADCWRLYLWDPPAVSIGRNQRTEKAVNMETVRTNNITVVRRLTGGRAIWHSGDVCFTHSGVTPGITDTISAFKDDYMRAAGVIIKFLDILGVRASISSGHPMDRIGLARVKAPCFQSSGRYEITVEGRKIAGIAQYRSADRFLIQGSIRLEPVDAMNARLFFEKSREGAASFRQFCQMVTSIDESLNHRVSFEELVAAFLTALDCKIEDIVDPVDLSVFPCPREIQESAGESHRDGG